MFPTTKVDLVILGHSGSADVDEITLVDEDVHGEEDENEIDNATHHYAVVNDRKKVKNK